MKTPDAPTKEVRTPKPQETKGTVVVLEVIPPAGDVSQGGHDHQVEGGVTEGTLSLVAVERPHGKAPARPDAPAREGGGRMVWGQDPMIWPNPDNPEGRARFVLDDPSESYLWRGLEECGHASVEALNRASELVSRDMFMFTEVQSLSLYL